MLRPFSASPYLPLRADNHYTLFHFSTEKYPLSFFRRDINDLYPWE